MTPGWSSPIAVEPTQPTVATPAPVAGPRADREGLDAAPSPVADKPTVAEGLDAAHEPVAATPPTTHVVTFGVTHPGAPPVAPQPVAPLHPRVIEHVGADVIFAPLPPIAWLCEGLRLAGGYGVTCFGGYGYSGKTVVAQTIALSVATGRDVFGVWRCRQGRVLHLDFEQGSRVTHERYQRLARGMGVALDDVADRLRLAVFPSVYLDSDDADDVFARTLDGFDVVIVDALRGAAPTVEENSSDVRRVIDLLARQSERTGTLPLLLVHARKPSALGAKHDDAPASDARFSLRGSSAIYDACSNVFVLGGKKGEPIRVMHEKDRLYGAPREDFGLRIEDTELDGDPRAGLRVVHMEPEQLGARSGGLGGLAKHEERITAWLAAHGGTFAGNKGALQHTIGMQRTAFFEAVSMLEATGRIHVDANNRTGTRISLMPEVTP